MMLNRYQGNSGRVVRVEDGSYSPAPALRGPGAPVKTRSGSPMKTPPRRGEPPTNGAALGGIGEKLSKLLPGSVGVLDTEDLILILILYLMYRESGDSELLIIMGAMFLL